MRDLIVEGAAILVVAPLLDDATLLGNLLGRLAVGFGVFLCSNQVYNGRK